MLMLKIVEDLEREVVVVVVVVVGGGSEWMERDGRRR